jgi:hypothetical protein
MPGLLFAYDSIVSLLRGGSRVIFIRVRIFTAAVLRTKSCCAQVRETRSLRYEDGIAPSISSEHVTRELPKKTVAKNFASLIT